MSGGSGGLRTLVQATIDQLLGRVAGRDGFELMSAFASPMPIAVITRMLGMADEPERLRRVGATMPSALDGVHSLDAREAVVRRRSRDPGQLPCLLDRAAREPGNDLTSALVAQQGVRITASELSSLVGLLLAGFETTVNAIGNGVRALLTNHEQWQLLVRDPSRAADVAGEVLRYDPPVQQTARVLRPRPNPVELAGVPVPPGQWVVLMLAAANRDPAVFSEPARFDVTRPDAADRLAFSGGIHYSLGAALARMEPAAAFRALAVRFPHADHWAGEDAAGNHPARATPTDGRRLRVHPNPGVRRRFGCSKPIGAGQSALSRYPRRSPTSWSTDRGLGQRPFFESPRRVPEHPFVAASDREMLPRPRVVGGPQARADRVAAGEDLGDDGRELLAGVRVDPSLVPRIRRTPLEQRGSDSRVDPVAGQHRGESLGEAATVCRGQQVTGVPERGRGQGDDLEPRRVQTQLGQQPVVQGELDIDRGGRMPGEHTGIGVRRRLRTHHRQGSGVITQIVRVLGQVVPELFGGSVPDVSPDRNGRSRIAW